MTNPKISVILSAYNEEKFISKAIESVVNQTLKDIEPWRKQKQGHENS